MTCSTTAGAARTRSRAARPLASVLLAVPLAILLAVLVGLGAGCSAGKADTIAATRATATTASPVTAPPTASPGKADRPGSSVATVGPATGPGTGTGEATASAGVDPVATASTSTSPSPSASASATTRRAVASTTSTAEPSTTARPAARPVGSLTTIVETSAAPGTAVARPTSLAAARSTASVSTTRSTTTTTGPASTSSPTSPPTSPTTSASTSRPTSVPDPDAVLIFTRTTGYRHPSIPDGIAAVRALAEAAGFDVVASEDPSRFTDAGLARFAAVVFLSTSGDVLDGGQQAAFERYIEGGGGYLGVHAASDTEYGWPWYGRLVGAWFADHPLVPNDQFVDCHCFTADVVRSAAHPSTEGLSPVWVRRDEWYNFRSPPPASATVVLRVDESTYPGGTMGSHHPVSWAQRIGAGRSFYTAMGHTSSSFAEPDFRRHLAGALRWVAGSG